MFCDRVLSFYQSLELKNKLPEGVSVMNPYKDVATIALVEKFYKKFYKDNIPRIFIAGINPGRLGGGTTGIPFTDPVKLEKNCGIENELPKKTELSADFIYQMILAYGGPGVFYNKFFFGAVCPLGFTKDGKNLNYYDQNELKKEVTPFIIESLRGQLKLGIKTDRCYCLGEGKNFEFLNSLNKEYTFFKKIIPLPHPRFIMQYRRKKINDFISMYVEKLDTP